MFCRFKFLFLVVSLTALSLFASSCGSSNAKLRIVQAIPDIPSAQALDIYLDGSKAQSSVGFGGVAPGSGYMSTRGGSRHLQVYLSGQTTGAYFDGNITLASGSEYTVVLTGFTTSLNVVAPLFTDTNTAPTSGNASVRIIHASPTWNYSYYPSGMDIYVVAHGSSISGVAPTVASLGYTKPSGYISAPAGSYDVIATPPTIAVPYITGGPFSFNSGDVRTVIFIDNPGGGLGQPPQSPIVLSDLGQ